MRSTVWTVGQSDQGGSPVTWLSPLRHSARGLGPAVTPLGAAFLTRYPWPGGSCGGDLPTPAEHTEPPLARPRVSLPEAPFSAGSHPQPTFVAGQPLRPPASARGGVLWGACPSLRGFGAPWPWKAGAGESQKRPFPQGFHTRNLRQRLLGGPGLLPRGRVLVC